jgi:drug/metabolite transporter (DMT)-like permease
MTPRRPPVALLTLLALVGFAANSLLCRTALRTSDIDPASFTSIRLASGALTLAAIVRLRGRPTASAGSFASAAALFAYAIAFSFAYVRLDSGTGALLLFGAVQMTMVGGAMARGERPRAREWLGLLVAIGGLVLLVFPSLSSPPPLAAASMLSAGAAWGVYSLRGKGTPDPLAATASNFARALPFALVVSVLAFGTSGPAHATTRGVACAVASGALASGIGYSLWYAALAELTATRAGIVQLSVPVVAAVGGVMLLGEHPTSRLAIASCAILGGIALATLNASRGPSAPGPSRPR